METRASLVSFNEQRIKSLNHVLDGMARSDHRINEVKAALEALADRLEHSDKPEHRSVLARVNDEELLALREYTERVEALRASVQQLVPTNLPDNVIVPLTDDVLAAANGHAAFMESMYARLEKLLAAIP